MAYIDPHACKKCAAHSRHSIPHPVDDQLVCRMCGTSTYNVLHDCHREVEPVYSYVMDQADEEEGPALEAIASQLLWDIAEVVRAGKRPLGLFEDGSDPACPLRIASKLGVSAAALERQFGGLGDVTLPKLMVWVTEGL